MPLLLSELAWDRCPRLARGWASGGGRQSLPNALSYGRRRHGGEVKWRGDAWLSCLCQRMWLIVFSVPMCYVSLWHRLIFDYNHTLYL